MPRFGSNAVFAPHVKRADRGGGVGDRHEHTVEIVSPDAHVAVRAFGLDRIVVHVRYPIAVDVRIGPGEALRAEVVRSADAVHEVRMQPAVRGGLPWVRAVARVHDAVGTLRVVGSCSSGKGCGVAVGEVRAGLERLARVKRALDPFLPVCLVRCAYAPSELAGYMKVM
jgi:hypothetical protein